MFRDELSRRAGRWHLSEPEFAMLWACREALPRGVGQSELAPRLAVSAAQVSGLVEKLRSQGLLQGRRAATDRRRQFWRLTPQGQATLQANLDDMADWAAQLDAQLGADASCVLVRWLDQLVQTWRNRPASAGGPPTPSGPTALAVDSPAAGDQARPAYQRGAA
jgi:DNA-binding MarR family transcriptional regulator